MTKEQVIEKFCSLSTKVASSQTFKWSESADCFCQKEHFPANFQFSEKIMSFIEKAVQEKLDNQS